MKRTLKHYKRAFAVGISLAALLAATPSFAAHSEGNVALRGYDGVVLTSGDSAPYSPKQTCSNTVENGLGSCHDYGTITEAYHFQQGFDQASGDFNPDKPWLQSPGMYGKW